MPLMYLNYQTSWLSLAYLKCTQNTYISLQLAKSSNTKPTIYEVLDMSNVKNVCVIGYRCS